MTDEEKQHAVAKAMMDALKAAYAEAERVGLDVCTVHTSLAQKLLYTCIDKGHAGCAMGVVGDVVIYAIANGLNIDDDGNIIPDTKH